MLPQISNNEIIPTGYQIFRKDRVHGKGGGVLIAISNALHSHSINITTSSELLAVKIESTLSLYCCCIYTPPNSPPDIYHDIFTSISQYFINNPVLLLGDFNLPDICWSSLSSSSPSGSTVCDYLFDLNLSQIITEPTSIHMMNSRYVAITNFPELITSTNTDNKLYTSVRSLHDLL